MKAISARAVKSLTKKTKCVCADNSGAKIVEIIAVQGYKGRLRQQPGVGIAGIVKVVVKKGKPEMRKKIETGIIVRTAKEYKRVDGRRIKFEDNAIVLIDEKSLPKGSEIKGAVAKEVGERFPKVAGISSCVI